MVARGLASMKSPSPQWVASGSASSFFCRCLASRSLRPFEPAVEAQATLRWPMLSKRLRVSQPTRRATGVPIHGCEMKMSKNRGTRPSETKLSHIEFVVQVLEVLFPVFYRLIQTVVVPIFGVARERRQAMGHLV